MYTKECTCEVGGHRCCNKCFRVILIRGKCIVLEIIPPFFVIQERYLKRIFDLVLKFEFELNDLERCTM